MQVAIIGGGICGLSLAMNLHRQGISCRVYERAPEIKELGVGITAYGVLSRGLISGHWTKDRAMAANEFRAHAPRFAAGNVERNLALVEALHSIADSRNATVAQIAIGWVLSRGSDVVPLVGARRRDRLQEALGALSLPLSAEDVRRIEQAVPSDAVAGERYAAPVMTTLDSER